jgi:hypothetical protein
MQDLKGKIQKDEHENTILTVFGKDRKGNFTIELGSIIMGTKPSREGMEWARKRIEKKYHALSKYTKR